MEIIIMLGLGFIAASLGHHWLRMAATNENRSIVRFIIGSIFMLLAANAIVTTINMMFLHGIIQSSQVT